MNRSRKLMTSFILSVLLLSGFLYMQQEMSVGSSKRSPSNAEVQAPVVPPSDESEEEVVDVTDEEPESDTPVTGRQKLQADLAQEQVQNGKHAPSLFHANQPGGNPRFLYEDKDNAIGGHSFVLLKPLKENPDQTIIKPDQLIGYHLSQYGTKHQHFVIANLSILEGSKTVNSNAIYSNNPNNDFYSVSARGGPRFRLIDILHGNVDFSEGGVAGPRPEQLPESVRSYNVTMFDGLLTNVPTDFQRHEITETATGLDFTPNPSSAIVSSTRSARFNNIQRFEHIDEEAQTTEGLEYVAVKYEDITNSYYLIHRIKGPGSYQQIVQVEFETPVNLKNMKAYKISKAGDPKVLDENRDNSLVPSDDYRYELKVNTQPVKFKVLKNVLWLPMNTRS